MKFISPIFFILSLFLMGPVYGKLISKIIGVAGGHYITSREVEINSLIESALFGTKIGERSNPDSKQFQSDVNSVLLELVVSLESEQFAVTSVAQEAVVQARQKLEKILRSRSDWRNLHVSSDEIANQVKRKLMAKQFIRFKVDSSYIAVTDTEAEDFFRKNPNLFKGVEFKSKKDEIKASLSRQKVDQRLQEWFGVLHKKYAVRNFVSPS